MENVIVIGAGPCGLAAAVALQRAGLSPLVIEKHNIVHSIYLYPTFLQFFSTAELLEIGGYPFVTPNEKPYRQEALVYYREVARREGLRMRAYEEALRLERRTDGGYAVHTADRFGRPHAYEARYVVVATGYFDQPNWLGIPGEELPKVSHYYREAHPYTGTKVAIIGGSNSAVDAAMDLLRAGAEVTVVYRGAGYSPSIKPWVRPIFESMVNKGRIRLLLESRVEQIGETFVRVRGADGSLELENDFVLALTGFRPERKLLAAAGVGIDAERGTPVYDPATMETDAPGLYVAGVVASAKEDANEIFIETGRLHGLRIAEHIAGK